MLRSHACLLRAPLFCAAQLSLGYNQLEGTIPNAFATATRLQLLSLQGVSRAAGVVSTLLCDGMRWCRRSLVHDDW